MLTTKNRVGLCLLALLFFASLVGGCRPPGARALFAGRRLLDAGDATNAVAEFQAATSWLPTNATAWNYLGLACHRAGQLTNALHAYRKALTLSPDLSEARYNLGCLWLEQNAFDQARVEFTAFTLRRPNQIDGWLKLGLTELRMRDLAAAEKSYGEALKLNSKSPQAHNGLGLVALQRSRPRDAVQRFTAATQTQPVYRPALLNLAITLQQHLKDRPQALQRYQQYLALTPKAADWTAVNAVAQALERESARALPPPATNEVAAVAPARNLAKSATNTPPPVVATTPKPAPPTNAVTPLVVAKPAPPPPTQTVAVAPPPEIRSKPALTSPPVAVAPPSEPAPAEVNLATDAQPAKAEVEKRSLARRLNPLNLFKRAPKTEIRPTPLPAGKRSVPPPPRELVAAPPPAMANSKPEAPVAIAAPKPIPRYVYHEMPKPLPGDRVEAERLFEQSAKLHWAGKLAEAIKAYRAAVQADPTYFEPQYNLALALGQAGDLAASLAAYESALALRPDSADALYNFALGLRTGGYSMDAANELERFLASHASDTRARLALANLYAQQLRQPAKARKQYNQLLDLEPRHPQADAIRHWLVQNPE